MVRIQSKRYILHWSPPQNNNNNNRVWNTFTFHSSSNALYTLWLYGGYIAMFEPISEIVL